MATNVRDPRSIITPDAFELAKELLGTPLAKPSRRLWAMLIDLTVIGLLTVVTSSITLVVWGAVAVFLISMAFRKPGRGLGQVGSMLFRGATGCLGVVILVGVLIGYLVVRASEATSDDIDFDDLADVAAVIDGDGGGSSDEAPAGASDEDGPDDAAGSDAPSSGDGIDLETVIGGLSGLAAMSGAETTDDAVAAAVRVLEAAGGAGLGPDEARDVLTELVPDDAPWRDDADLVIDRAFEEVGVGAGDAAAGDEAAEDAEAGDADEVDETEQALAALEEELAALETDEAIARYLEMRTSRAERRAAAEAAEQAAREAAAAADDAEDAPDDAEDAPEAPAPDPAAELQAALDDRAFAILSERMTGEFAGDSIETLADRLLDTRRDLARTERRADQAEAAIAAGAGGFRGLLRDIWEQAGSAIGLWSVYFTMALTLTGGRTVGKKLMGLRVLRLDGAPLTWWSSFERAGGYVAGIATGTLGFVQVFWDSNRQCVHDKIVGTVVVVDGAEIEPGAWQEAWAAQRESNG